MGGRAVAIIGLNTGFAVGFKILAAFLCVSVTVLLVVMLAYQAVLDARVRKTAALRHNVREAAGRMVAGSGGPAIREPDREALFSKKGLAELLRLMDEMTEEGQKALRQMLHSLRYETYVNRQLDEKLDPEHLALVVRMVAALNLTELDGRVIRLLYAYPKEIALQYEAFMTLSRLGSAEPLMQVCMDRSFAQSLSFRSLQQILGAYSGDRTQLYAYLLQAPDPYVVRTCLKLIGLFQMKELAHEVEDKLQKPDDDNLLMDAMRCLGRLHHAPAAGKIAAFSRHPRWEVRAIAATALGQVDPVAGIGVLTSMLCDPEWQVRYNAGLALWDAGLLTQVAPHVQATGDAFAMDMLRYMTQTCEIWRAAP